MGADAQRCSAEAGATANHAVETRGPAEVRADVAVVVILCGALEIDVVALIKCGGHCR